MRSTQIGALGGGYSSIGNMGASAEQGVDVGDEGERRFYPPWGNEAANADALNATTEADRDPDLEEKLLAAGMRKYRLRGVVTYAPSSPYLWLLFAVACVPLGFLAFWAGVPRGMSPEMALVFAIGMWIFAAVMATLSTLSLRKWHRLRRIALNHVAATGGKLPHERAIPSANSSWSGVARKQ